MSKQTYTLREMVRLQREYQGYRSEVRRIEGTQYPKTMHTFESYLKRRDAIDKHEEEKAAQERQQAIDSMLQGAWAGADISEAAFAEKIVNPAFKVVDLSFDVTDRYNKRKAILLRIGLKEGALWSYKGTPIVSNYIIQTRDEFKNLLYDIVEQITDIDTKNSTWS